jgi:hypothetical protein
MKTYEVYQDFKWKERAKLWDDFLAKITLAKIAVMMQSAPLKAWQTLIEITSKKLAKDADRIRASEAILDRTGYPRASERIVDTTIREIRDMSDEDLRRVLLTGVKALTVEGEVRQLEAPIEAVQTSAVVVEEFIDAN